MLLGFLLLGREGLEPLLMHTLGEQLLDALSSEDLLEGSLGLFDQAKAESAETELHDGAVVEDLGSDVGGVNGLLEMGHQEHVASGVVVVVERVVVDVAEHGAGSQEGVPRLVEEDAKRVDESGGVGRVGESGRRLF